MARLSLFVVFISILSLAADATSVSSSTSSVSSSYAEESTTSSTSSAWSSSTSATTTDKKKPVKCKANQEYSNCTQTLGRRLKCSQQGKPVPSATKPKRCKRGCVCQAGYLKTANGTCVPETQCYGKLVCEDSEIVNSCPKKRINDYCKKSENDNAEDSTSDQSQKCGKPVCTCRFNYRRDPDSGKCIPSRDCPPFTCSRPKEVYNACPPYCPTDDCSQATLTGRCPVIGRIGIVVECKPACRCIEGYWRNNGTCVPYLACPGKCPNNEKFSSCIQAECRALNCTQKDKPIACAAILAGSCQQGCVCVEGTLRNKNGTCVPENKCPVVCKANEEFSNCTQSVCRRLNCSQQGQPLKCQNANSSAVTCTSGCICQSGYLKTANGDCVPESQCYGDLVCKDTEVVNTCPNYGFSDKCPTSEKESQLSMVAISKPCENPVCACRFNYKRAKNGSCIPTRNCPPFECSGLNQEYNPCPPLCPTDDCGQATPTGICPLGRIGIILQCNPKCRCKSGYWKNNGVCVPYLECPGKCPKNETFSSCIQAECRALNCTQKNKPIACPLIAEDSCQQGCVCVEGTLRDKNGTCVPENQCPAPTCGKNETLSECPNGCDPIACPKSYKEEQAWKANCVAPAYCLPTECRCIKDYRRDSNGRCIYIGECPNICPKNEEFSNCTQACGRAQNCSQTQPITSTAVADGSCRSGCICKKGTLRNADGNCVPNDQCPAPQCGKNEEISCVHDCPPQRTCKTRGIKFNCLDNYKRCKDQCVCKPGYYKNTIGECITGKECDTCKGLNEFFSCGTECDNDCSNLGTQNRTNCPFVNKKCNPKCYCEDGFARNATKHCIPVEKCPKCN